MKNSKSKKADEAKPSSLHDLQIQRQKKCQMVSGFLVLAVFVIGMGIYLNNPDGLTKEEQCLLGKVSVAFLWLAGFAIGIYTYFNKPGTLRHSYGLTEKEQCQLGVGYFLLAVFTIGIGIYLNKEEVEQALQI